MLKILQQASRWLASNASLFIIAIAVFTFFVPDTFGWVRGNTQTVILGLIMLTMGLTLTTDDFKILARRPLDILIGACHALCGVVVGTSVPSGTSLGSRHSACRLLPWRCVKQHHVVSLSWRCGLFCRNDLRLHTFSARHDTLADGTDCRCHH